eukprot:10918942-Prorocentrum_lima.AAC.1
MTSSLVGSEMCIRDRTVVVGCRGTLPECVVVDGLAVVSVPRTALLGPVSYTHLTLPTICSV